MARRIQALAWDWTQDGAVITVNVDGTLVEWLIPLAHVQVHFGEQLARVGCPLAPSVGAPSVGGLFGSISKAFKGASRSVKRAMPKAIRRAASKVSRLAVKGVRAYQDIERKTLKTLRHVPVLGSAANAALEATRMRNLLIAGRLPTVQNLAALGRAAGATALDVVAPGSGTLANAALTAGMGLASGQRWDRALKAGGVQAASRYVPKSVARGALSAGEALARGQRVDRALYSGAQGAAQHYLGQQLGRVAPALKSNLFGLTKIATKGLPLPSGQQVANAHRVWSAMHHAEEAAKRMRAGRALPWDPNRLVQGQRTLASLRSVVQHARAGHGPAMSAVHAFRRVGACL